MIKENEYSVLVKKHSKPSPKPKDFIMSFVIGGLICTFGEFLFSFYASFDIKGDILKAAVPSTLIVIAAFLTGFGIYEKLAKHAGAGTLVPITGFANAICSSAIEYKNEGFIMGVGASIFKIAGPVILYGTAASIIYGIIYYLIKVLGG